MALPEPPLWCRIVLLILTISSFAPQIWRIQATQSVKGISPSYVLWNLISATEQLTIYFFLLVNLYDPTAKNIILHIPISTGDWFSLGHCAVVTVLFLALFAQILLYSERRTALCVRYTAFLLVSLIPLLIDAVSPVDPNPDSWLTATYSIFHMELIWPITTFLGCFGIYRQAQEIRAVSFPNSLSLQGLAVQAIVFMLVSVAWIWCLPFPYERLEGHIGWNTFTVWYGTVGWVIVNNFIFAIGQVILLALALRRWSSDNIQREGETEPLLG